jgi:hypothetical protein
MDSTSIPDLSERVRNPLSIQFGGYCREHIAAIVRKREAQPAGSAVYLRLLSTPLLGCELVRYGHQLTGRQFLAGELTERMI